MNIYKYTRFDKYSLENFRKNQIWCNYYQDFNDPYECWCIEKRGIPDPNKEKKRYNRIIKEWGYDPGSSNVEEYYEYLSEFNHQRAMRVEDFVESARISCYSRRGNNLLLWSHYSGGLRGFCLEFESEKLIESSPYPTAFYDVNYRLHPPIVDTMLYEVANDQVWYHEMVITEEEKKNKCITKYIPDRLLPAYHVALEKSQKLLVNLYSKMLCNKPIYWEYEEEIRLILHTNSSRKQGISMNYSEEALKSVIIGEKADQKDIKRLLDILKNNDLSVPIKMAFRNKTYYMLRVVSYK